MSGMENDYDIYEFEYGHLFPLSWLYHLSDLTRLRKYATSLDSYWCGPVVSMRVDGRLLCGRKV